MEHNDRKKERKFVKLHLWAPHKKNSQRIKNDVHATTITYDLFWSPR